MCQITFHLHRHVRRPPSQRPPFRTRSGLTTGCSSSRRGDVFQPSLWIQNKMFEHFQLCFVNEVFLTGRVNVCVETQPDISARFRQHQYFQSVVCGGRTRCFSRVIRTFSGRVCGIFTNCKPEHKHRVIYNIQLLRYLDSSGSGCNGGGCQYTTQIMKGLCTPTSS